LINISRDYGSVVDPEDLRLYFFETPFGTVSCDKFPKIAVCKTCGDACKACAEECRKVAS
jgi:hypothetical protein